MDTSTPICSSCLRRPSEAPHRVCVGCRASRNKTYRNRTGLQATVHHPDPPRPLKRRRLDDPTPLLSHRPPRQLPHAPENTPLSSSTPLEPPHASIDEPVGSPHLIFQTRAVPLTINHAQRRRLQRIAPSFSSFSDQIQPRIPPLRPVLIPHRDRSPEQPDEGPDIDPPSSDDSDNAEREDDTADSDYNGNANAVRSSRGRGRTIQPITHTRGQPRVARRAPDAFISEYHRVEAHDLGLMEHTCQHCGALHWLAERGVSNSMNPRWQLCCKDGEVDLSPMPDPPPFLRHLFQGEDRRSKLFRKEIRRYNAALAFTSLSYTKDERLANQKGFKPFQIHGETYHKQGSLRARNSQVPSYAQLFFFDPDYAADIRTAKNPQCDRDLMQDLTAMLQEHNPYISMYKTAQEKLDAQPPSAQASRMILTPRMQLILEKGADKRRENLPTTMELAGLLPLEYGEPCFRDVVIALRDDTDPDCADRKFSIEKSHPAYMPLHYVLFFPFGGQGHDWSMRLRDRRGTRTRTKLTARMFYSHRLHTRPAGPRKEFPIVLHGRRLTQQYIIEAWSIIEDAKLRWIRANQKTLRRDVYLGVVDALAQDADIDPDNIGKRFILPSSYIGSSRFMTQCFQDSMAIVGAYGKPTFFITVTCNPNWPEIRQNLFPGQSADDRPDLIARVFHAKLQAILHDIKKKHVFGRHMARCWTIEYQKRGLPHCHILLWVEAGQRFHEPEFIDQIVRAELPDPELDRDGSLTAAVKRHMVHQPCGSLNPGAVCMDKKDKVGNPICGKGFPKAFTDATVVDEDGYPNYRRRDDGRTWDVSCNGRTIALDNRSIVPYNPYLLKRYDAHINVEVCTTVNAIKYIHKYIYKGSDLATVNIEDDYDETNMHIQARYLGPTQAAWQIFAFPVHEEKPAVTVLSVHEPDKQPVAWPEGATDEEIRGIMESSRSKLMAYFELHRENPNGPKYLYQEIPAHFVWSTKACRWIPRKQGQAIGRIHHANPTQGERYYLRMLLTNVRGPQSFEDLRTVDGTVYDTFRQACVARGLLDDDKEWITCFTDATRFSTGRALRNLFVIALLHGSVADPLALWERFRDQICDDLPYRLRTMTGVPPDLADPHLDYGLYLIQQELRPYDKDLSDDFSLPRNVHAWERVDGNTLLAIELDYNAADELLARNANYEKFNVGQRDAFNRIVTAVESGSAESHFFLHGPAGTGKTFLYRTLCHHFRAQGKVVICVASSGIASLLLPGGTTSHSRFKIPLVCHESSTCNVSPSDQIGKLLQQTDLIIWDEVPMQGKKQFEAVHRMLCDVRGSNDLFGGIPVVLGGDFAQILPVVKGSNRARTVEENLQQSFIWPNLQLLFLHENMRVRAGEANQRFSEYIRSMSYRPELRGTVPLPDMIPQYQDQASFCHSIFPPALMAADRRDLDFFARRAILSVRNETAAEINAQILSTLRGEMHEFHAVDTAVSTDGGILADQLNPEFLATFTPSGLPPAKLELKIGAPIILLRNLNPRQGLCNGTRLVITRYTRFCIEAQILGGPHHGEIRLIPRITLHSTEGDYPWIHARKQFPVRLCFAMTINKSQGQSLDIVGVDLRHPVFTHGQLYVALSRATNVESLSVLLPGERGAKTENIVYPEVLLHDPDDPVAE